MSSFASLALVSTFNVGATAHAAPGDPDPTFGDGGVAAPLFASSGGYRPEGVAIQSNGKVVVAGWVSRSNTGDDFALARFNQNGTLDSTFGSGGTVVTDFGDYEQAHSVALQPDGKIVAAGGPSFCFGFGCPSPGFELARYLPDGSLDTSFSGDGKAAIQGTPLLSPELRRAFDVAIQTDGKIVAVGWPAALDFAIVRLNPNGSLDSDFSLDGIVTVDGGGDELAYATDLQTDGKIVAGGNHDRDGMVARVTASGALDRSFGSGGTVVTPFDASYRAIQDLLVQPDGKIAVAGQTTTGVTPTNNTKTGFIVARYRSDGALDSSFSEDGIAVTDFSSSGGTNTHASALELQADGKLVAAGHFANVGFVALARYLPDGSPDPSFGSGGKIASSIRGDVGDAALQPDGKLVLACCSAAARFLMGASTPVEQAPVLSPIGNKTVDEGQQLQFTVSATDPDGDPLSYSASNLPPGASFNTATGTFTWTPTTTQSGIYRNVRFGVSDGTLTDSEEIAITVNDPRQDTVTMLVLSATARRLLASGDVTPNQAGEEMKVTLYRKRDGGFRRVSTERPVLDEASEYETGFRRPDSRRCRVRSRFPGNADAEPSEATKTFHC